MNYLTLIFPLATVGFLLLVFSEYFPLLCRQLPPRRGEDRRWHRRDSLVCLLICVVYALTAFTGLGDRQGVQSVCRFTERDQAVTIRLPAAMELSDVRYFPSLHTGQYRLEYSIDGVSFTQVGELPQKYADLFKWKSAEFTSEQRPAARYVRIVADQALWLGELALYDAHGALIDAASLDYPAEYAALFDEQALVPAKSNFHNSSYFDEIYHARTALEHIENLSPYEISHPPLGKLILSLGIRLFGMVPFGWRFMGTLTGVLMLPALYYFLKKMFGGSLIPPVGTVLMASDFMHFVQTRIATIDSYVVFFILLMYLFFWLYWQSDRDRRRSWLPPLALSGLCFGLGAASKWTGIYAGAGLAVLWLIDRIRRIRTLYAAGQRRRAWTETGENVLWCLLLFVALPAGIYYLSYWPYGTAAGLSGPRMLFSREYLDIVLDNQKYMFNYHRGVTSTHPYSSLWWQWILDIRPILYYLEYFDNGSRSAFGAWVNPLLCWGGLLAMLCMVYQAVVCRDRAALFILVGYLAQLLPWVLVRRVVFEYHYFPSTIFLILALCHVLHSVQRLHFRPRGIILSVPAVSLLLFVMFYPALSGLPIPGAYGDYFLSWLPSWPF